MIKVYLLTLVQRQALAGKQWAADSYFGPTQDCEGNWFISVEEVEGMTEQWAIDHQLEWVFDLPKILYCQPVWED